MFGKRRRARQWKVFIFMNINSFIFVIYSSLANKDALTLSADFLTLFIVGRWPLFIYLFFLSFDSGNLLMYNKIIIITEAINRAAQVAKTEDSTTIEFSHLEKILPQLLLDFWITMDVGIINHCSFVHSSLLLEVLEFL